MDSPCNRLHITALLILACLAGAGAQDEKVVIRLLPKPNQSVRFEMIQETDVDVIYEGIRDTSSQGTANEKMMGKSVFAFTQKNGAMDDSGKMEAKVTYEKVSMERSMNGKPEPADDTSDKLIGKTITLTFDKEGSVVDVKVPPEVEIPADTFKQVMSSLYSNLPRAALAIGETATMPFRMTLPIPDMGSGPLDMEGQTKYRLMSITSEERGRVARFEQTVEASLTRGIEVDTYTGKGKVQVDFKLSGGGTLQLNLDQGIMKAGDLLTTLDGNMTMEGASQNAKPQVIRFHGTTKMASTGSLSVARDQGPGARD